MQGRYDSMMLMMLRKDFPDVASIIDSKLKEQMPDLVLTDFSKIPLIIDLFKQNYIINAKETHVSWDQASEKLLCRLSSDEQRYCKVTEIREILLSVILKFYHPERILGLTEGKVNTKRGLVKEITNKLGCVRESISTSISNSIIYYKTYNSFKKEVNNLYDLIKPNLKT